MAKAQLGQERLTRDGAVVDARTERRAFLPGPMQGGLAQRPPQSLPAEPGHDGRIEVRFRRLAGRLTPRLPERREGNSLDGRLLPERDPPEIEQGAWSGRGASGKQDGQHQ